MFGFGKLRFKGVDKKTIDDQAHIDDYNAAEEIGRVRLGKLCLYYKDLGRRYYVPYEYIDRRFTRVNTVEPDDSPAYFYYRLILVHGEKEAQVFFKNHLHENGFPNVEIVKEKEFYTIK